MWQDQDFIFTMLSRKLVAIFSHVVIGFHPSTITAVTTLVTGWSFKHKAWNFAAPCNLFIMLNKILWLLGSDSSLHFCRGRESCFFFLFFFSIRFIIKALSVFGGPSYMVLYFAQAYQLRRDHLQVSTQNRKKMFSHLFTVVWLYYLYFCWH